MYEFTVNGSSRTISRAKSGPRQNKKQKAARDGGAPGCALPMHMILRSHPESLFCRALHLILDRCDGQRWQRDPVCRHRQLDDPDTIWCCPVIHDVGLPRVERIAECFGFHWTHRRVEAGEAEL